jgi:heme A synthase
VSVTSAGVRPAAAVRRAAFAALAVSFVHIVFGAIVRISGSGLGCGEHWPRCADPVTGRLYWFPPFDQPTLVVEWTHRLLAAILITAVVALVVLAFAHRRDPGVRGRGGVLRSAGVALGLVLCAAAFGAVTVFYGNPAWATAVHKGIAASLLATLAVAVMRCGALGGARAVAQSGSARATRGTAVAAGLAFVAVLLGALVAKVPDAAIACTGFPLCGAGSIPGLAHLQLTHRIVAYLLAFHILGLTIGFARRREAGAVLAAVRVAMGVVVLQIALGAAMVLLHFPTVLRSAHQANGIVLWLTTFVAAYLARLAAGVSTPAFALPARVAPDVATPTGELPVMALESGR